jgi:CrcB protein
MMIAIMAIAGGLGAIARFMLDGLIRARLSRAGLNRAGLNRGHLNTMLPLGTMIINVSGSLLLGFVTGLVLFHAIPSDLQLVVGTGFLGGYTTFSTASFETARLIQERQFVAALVNGVGMLLLAVAAAVAGLGLAWLV